MNKFLFIDLETTSLDIVNCKILEVAAVVTDNKLNILEEFSTPVKAPDVDIAAMDDWCRTTHTQSRLLEDVADAGVDLEEAEKALQRLKRKHFPVSKPEIGGSSVHFDKYVIQYQMKSFSKELSHRIVDVSSFMCALDKYRGFKLPSQPEPAHRALADIKQSISYLKQYLEEFR
jgi:oligoribonuclease